MQAKADARRRIPAPARSRGRPRAFDREAALDRALGLFWTQGFEGTSISDLTEALDINPPSLYAAFGSKEELFREALGLYVRAYGLPVERAIAEEKTALDAVGRILREAARLFPAGATPGGCPVSSGTLTCAPDHRSIADVVAATRELMVTALEQRITVGKAKGEIPRDADPATLARYVATVISGMSVQARDGADGATLLAIAEVALAAWPSRPRSPQLSRTNRRSGRTSR
jgi:AcrR family transcriptional regulator